MQALLDRFVPGKKGRTEGRIAVIADSAATESARNDQESFVNAFRWAGMPVSLIPPVMISRSTRTTWSSCPMVWSTS